MAKFKRLQSHQGASEVNIEGVSYPVVNNEVSVPEELVAPLLHIGGFTADPELEPVPDGKIRVAHDSATNCSWNGEVFEANEAGHFHVPCGAVADLLHHGFTAVEAVAEAPAAITALKLPA